jgi:hypothetical protein
MYRIIGADGKEYGPITADQVRQWINEGRANAQTRVLLEGTTEWKTLGELPEFGGASPSIAPPGPVPGMPAMPMPGVVSAASDMITGPAIGLIVTGILNIIFAAARTVLSMVAAGGSMMMQRTGNPEFDKIFTAMTGTVGIALGVVGFLGGILILIAGVKMKKLEAYGLAVAGSIIAMIPCLSTCCIVGLPIGILALVVLSKPEVKASFH